MYYIEIHKKIIQDERLSVRREEKTKLPLFWSEPVSMQCKIEHWSKSLDWRLYEAKLLDEPCVGHSWTVSQGNPKRKAVLSCKRLQQVVFDACPWPCSHRALTRVSGDPSMWRGLTFPPSREAASHQKAVIPSPYFTARSRAVGELNFGSASYNLNRKKNPNTRCS